MWGSPRGLANQARVPGAVHAVELLPAAPSTGADVRYVSGLPGDARARLVLTGSLLQVVEPRHHVRWAATRLAVTRVLTVLGNARRGAFVLALCGERDVVLLDARDGATTWQWSAPAGTNLSGAGSSRAVRHDGRDLWLCFPSYSTAGECFDLTDPHAVVHAWTCELGSRIDAGFGPVVVVADLLRRGSPQVVLSTRTGTAYGTDEFGVLTTAQLVLGRADGHLLQAVLDLTSGELLTSTAYRPDPGPYPCARPYGLLQVVSLSPGAAPDIVLVSCQVEEYVSVTASEQGLGRRWGWFVEKDWPTDLQELRPQVSSVADVLGDGHPLLVVGHWDGESWATLLIDPRRGVPDGVLTRLDGRYFWGCADLDGDGVPEILLSAETTRAPSAFTTVEVYDARAEETVGRLQDVAVVTTADSDLPPDTTFHAERRGAVTVSARDGRRGLVVVDRATGHTQWWSPARDRTQPRRLWDRTAVRVDQRQGAVVLTDSTGVLTELGPDLVPAEAIQVRGATSQPLCWPVAGGFQFAIEHHDGTTELWLLPDDAREPRLGHRLAGRRPVVHADGAGVQRLAVVDVDDGLDVVRIYHLGGRGGAPVLLRSHRSASPVQDLLPFGDEFQLVVNRRIGVHTSAVDVLDATGAVAWTDPERGAHPNLPAAFQSRDGRWMTAYDDHGVLVVRDASDGRVLVESDWTAAYTTPMYVDVGGDELLVRCDGVHGVEALDLAGVRRWRTPAELWHHYPGSSSLVRLPTTTLLATATRAGTVDLLDLSDGTRRHRITVGRQAEHRPIATVADAAGDLLVVGTAAGEVLCLDPARPDAPPRWAVQVDSAVAHLAVASGPVTTLIIASTADGRQRLLRTVPGW